MRSNSIGLERSLPIGRSIPRENLHIVRLFVHDWLKMLTAYWLNDIFRKRYDKCRDDTFQNNMADFLVAILSTLVIFLLSYLFWKWHNQRNNLTNEGENRPVFSRADMLKNRLKRFELKNDKTSDELTKGSKIISI